MCHEIFQRSPLHHTMNKGGLAKGQGASALIAMAKLEPDGFWPAIMFEVSTVPMLRPPAYLHPCPPAHSRRAILFKTRQRRSFYLPPCCGGIE